MNLDQNSQPQQGNNAAQERVTTGILAAAAVVLVSLVAFVFSEGNYPISVPQTASVALHDSFADIAVQAKSAIVVDVHSGTVLYEHNADDQLPLASLTKVSLAYAVAQTLNLQSSFVLSESLPPVVTANGIPTGTRMTVQELLDYTLAASSNEGAELLARMADDAVRAQFPEAPQGEATLWLMNKNARDRSLTRTYFANPSGLDLSENTAGAYGSARDVASFFAFIAETQPDVFARTTTEWFSIGSVAVGNTNEALSAIPGLIMGKTGYTDLAGGNLAVVFDAGPTRTIAIVVLGSTKEGRFSDMKTLIDATRIQIAGVQ